MIRFKPPTTPMTLADYQASTDLTTPPGHNAQVYLDLKQAYYTSEAAGAGCLVEFRNRGLGNKSAQTIASLAAAGGFELMVAPPAADKKDTRRFMYLVKKETN